MITIIISLLLLIGIVLWVKSIRKAKSETAEIDQLKL